MSTAGDAVLHRPRRAAAVERESRRVDIGRLGLDGGRLGVVAGAADVAQRCLIRMAHQDVDLILAGDLAEVAHVLATHTQTFCHRGVLPMKAA
jgi:hypothetical protein